MKGAVFVISGPSGSGKTTLLKKLLQSKTLKAKLVKSVSLTTRPRRTGEREGRDYFFVTPEQFRKARKDKKILEWTRYLGYYYATPKGYVDLQLSRGRSMALCLDLRGALRLKRIYQERTVTIFVLPPSVKALQRRIEKRCQKTKKDEICRRVRFSREELSACSRYDYCVLNSDLRQAVKELRRIVAGEIALKERGSRK